MPSECLPLEICNSGVLEGKAATLSLVKNRMVLTLARRKNKPHGSTLTRTCWCKSCPKTCPVHVLGAYVTSLKDGERPFAQFSASNVLKSLRSLLSRIGVRNAEKYRTHDLIRGHAKDLQARGASLVEILSAGEWRSPAFLRYLDMHDLERDAVIEAHLDESSGSESCSGDSDSSNEH